LEEAAKLVQGGVALCPPGGGKGVEAHLRLGATRGAGPAADFARDDEGTNGAFGGVIVRRDPGVAHAGKQFVLEVPEPPRQRATRMAWLLDKLGAQGAQVLVQALGQRQRRIVCGGWGRARGRARGRA